MQGTVKKKRNLVIDYLRGIAALALIVNHSIISTPVDLRVVSWCNELSHFTATFDMPLFFLLAGFVFSCTDYAAYMKKKVIRIGIPYLVFGFGSVILHAFAGSLLAGGGASLVSGMYNLVFCGGNYWFLYCIFIIYTVYPWITKVCNTLWKETILLVVLIFIRQFVPIPDILTLPKVFTYLPYFCIGHICGQLYSKGKLSDRNWTGVLLISIFSSVVLYSLVRNKIMTSWVVSVVLALSICIALAVSVSLVMKRIGSGKVINLIGDCGKYSLQIYLFNMYITVVLRVLICRVLGITNPFGIISILVLLNLLFSLPLCKWVIPKSKVLRLFCGL